MSIATEFKRVREEVGASQTAFAQLIGISQAYVSQIESGTRVNISDGAIDAIAAIDHAVYNTPSPESIAALRRAARAGDVRVVTAQSGGDVVVPMLNQTIHAGDPLPVVALMVYLTLRASTRTCAITAFSPTGAHGRTALTSRTSRVRWCATTRRRRDSRSTRYRG